VKRRITVAIVGVSALILVVLGIPLAIAVHQSILNSEVVELQATAARTLTEINVPINIAQLDAVSGEPDAPPPFSVYDSQGRIVFGDGPPVGDAPVAKALRGIPASTTSGEIVVATPINDDTTENVVGALRLTESLGGANHRSRLVVLVMAATGLVALAGGWMIASRVARRLSRPITDLASAAERIGDGGVVERAEHYGVHEIDTLATALSTSSERVSQALARERRFSADVSHQLRTPLTALRLRLEAARTDRSADTIDHALDDLSRVEQTVAHLLAFARDSMPSTATVQLDLATRQAVDRWSQRARSVGRSVTVTTSEPVVTRGSARSVDQILDVLIDNALNHGSGRVQLTQRRLARGGAVDVIDEGSTIPPGDSERIFHRGHGEHNGIGLALARSIAEAEGGRLVLAHLQPTTFSLILLYSDQNGDD
jgi:signal transduction histidine kinase